MAFKTDGRLSSKPRLLYPLKSESVSRSPPGSRKEQTRNALIPTGETPASAVSYGLAVKERESRKLLSQPEDACDAEENLGANYHQRTLVLAKTIGTCASANRTATCKAFHHSSQEDCLASIWGRAHKGPKHPQYSNTLTIPKSIWQPIISFTRSIELSRESSNPLNNTLNANYSVTGLQQSWELTTPISNGTLGIGIGQDSRSELHSLRLRNAELRAALRVHQRRCEELQKEYVAANIQAEKTAIAIESDSIRVQTQEEEIAKVQYRVAQVKQLKLELQQRQSTNQSFELVFQSLVDNEATRPLVLEALRANGVKLIGHNYSFASS